MSNDLISRSALLKRLNEFCGKQRYLVPENVWNMIENAPTAYDVGKVVEQLEHLDLDGIRMKEDGKHYLIRQGEAIEIVKAGGVNE